MLLFTILLILSASAVEVIQGDGMITFPDGRKLKGTNWDIDGVKVGAYLGIPFAKPPVGDLRFAAPVPIKPWSGTLEAKRLPPTCWQAIVGGFDIANSGARIWVNNTRMDEDCFISTFGRRSGAPHYL